MENIKRNTKITVISCFLWGVLAHGMAMFNKFSSFDDVESLFGAGTTYSLGRWMLSIINVFSKKIYGSTQYSVPVYNVALSILFIALTLLFIIDLLKIQNKWSIIAICGIGVTFPVITGIFGYMFTAPFYAFGFLLAAGGVWLVYAYEKWYTYVIGMLILACSVGVYQAVIPLVVSLMLLKLFTLTLDADIPIAKIWKKIAGSILICCGFMGIYFGINSLVLKLLHTSLSGYKGINNFGLTSPLGYFKRVLYAYTEFFNPTNHVQTNMYPFSLRIFYYILLCFLILLMGKQFWVMWKKDKAHAALGAVGFLFIPLSTNLIYVMCDASAASSLMLYGQVVIFIWLVVMLEKASCKKERLVSCLYKCGIALIGIMCALYVRFDNICYLKAAFVQEQTLDYYERLVTRIQSCEGYSENMKVLYIGEFDMSGEEFPTIPEFECIYLNPYMNSDIMVKNYAWKTSLKLWVGFAPELAEIEEIRNTDAIDDLNCYPSDGSIAVIDDIVVVKFAENK